MKKNKLLYIFLFSLVTATLVTFFTHVFILKFLNKPLFDNLIIEAYSINAILALVIFSSLYIFRYKWTAQIGFLFLAGSFLKFIFFFIIFNPVYKNDGVVETLEFTAFFIPYLLSLFLETFFTAKMLNNLN